MAAQPRTPIEELQEKLTSAIKENTRAQAEAMKSATVEGAEIRKLKKETAAIEKKSAFIERDLGKELGESLAAPFKSLTSIIPKPLKILASMPVQAMMRGQMAGKAPAARVDASGTPIHPEGNKAFTEAMGREMSQKGYYKGAIAASAAKIPGMGMLGEKWAKDDDASKLKKAVSGFMGFSDVDETDKLLKTMSGQLNEIKHELTWLNYMFDKSAIARHSESKLEKELQRIYDLLSDPDSTLSHEELELYDTYKMHFEHTLDARKDTSARDKEDRGEKRAEKKRDDKRESSWRKLLLGKFGSLGKGGGIMASLGGLLLKGGKALGAGMGEAGKWVAGAMAGKFALGKLFGGGSKALATSSTMTIPGFAPSMGVSPTTAAAAPSLGARVATATGGRIMPWGQGAGALSKARLMPAGGGMMANVAAVAAPLAAAGMALKDGADLMWSMEERWAKGRENVGGIAGGVSGAVIGGIIGSVVPVVGTMIGAGVGGIVGNLVGEMIGKKMDKAVDERTRAQLTALGRRYDELTKEKEKVMASDRSLTEKKRALLKMDAKQIAIETEAAAVEHRQKLINEAEEKQARLEEQALNLQLYNTYKDHFEQIKTGYGAHATDAYKALEKDRLAAVEAEKVAIERYNDTMTTADLNLAAAAKVEVIRIKELQKQLGGEGNVTMYHMLPAIKAQREVMSEAQDKFLETNEEMMKELDIWQGDIAFGGRKERLKELTYLQKKIDAGDELNENEQKIADKWNVARDEYMSEIDKRTANEKEEADKLKKQREEGEGVSKLVNWEAILDEQKRPWKKTWRTPSADQAAFHQEGESEADYRKRIGAPTSGVTGGAIYGMPMQGPAGRYVDTTGIRSGGTVPGALGQPYTPGGVAGTTTAAAAGAVTDTTKAFGGYSDEPLWQQELYGYRRATRDNEVVYKTYLDEEMTKWVMLHELKMKELDEQILAAELDGKDTKRLEQEKTLKKANFETQMVAWQKDEEKQAELIHEFEHRKYKEAMEIGRAPVDDPMMWAQAADERFRGSKAQTMGDEAADQAAQDAALASGVITRQYYGKDTPITGQEDTGDFSDLATVISKRIGPSDYVKAGEVKAAEPVEGKLTVDPIARTAEINALIEEGIELQKRIAESKNWFKNVYKGIDDAEGRVIDEIRLDEIKKQVKAMQVPVMTGAVSDIDDIIGEAAFAKAAVSETTAAAAAAPRDIDSWGIDYTDYESLKKTAANPMLIRDDQLGEQLKQIAAVLRSQQGAGEDTTDLQVLQAAYGDALGLLKTWAGPGGVRFQNTTARVTAGGDPSGLTEETRKIMEKAETGQQIATLSMQERQEFKNVAKQAATEGDTGREGAALKSAVSKTTTQAAGGKSEEEILWGGDAPLSEKEYDKYSDFPGDLGEWQDYKMEWGLRYKDRTRVSALTAGKSDAEIAKMAAAQTDVKKTLKDSFAATDAAVQQGAVSDTTTATALGPAAKMAMIERGDVEEYKRNMVMRILGRKGYEFDPAQISKMMETMVVTETDSGFKASLKGGFRLGRFLTLTEMKDAEALIKSVMGEKDEKTGLYEVSQMSASLGPEMSAYLAQVSPTQQQAQAKTAVLNQGASAAAAQAGQGGDTNVTVVAPTTANSTTTNQNINPNPLMSTNPRTAMGVDW